jgi:hypothetical protein
MSTAGIALLFGVLLITHFVQGGCAGADGVGPSGLIARVEALESQARTDRATISKQSKQIATLEEDLKAAKAAADKAVADAKSALIAQITANRKEVYSDIGSIFVIAQVPLAYWGFDQSHMHDNLANEAEYMVGIRNGQRAATAGSYRMMPKAL